MAKPIEELEYERDEAQQARISGIEAYFLIAFALLADGLEFVANFLVVTPTGVGQLIAILFHLVAKVISGGIIMWSFLRGARGRIIIQRFVGVVIAFLVDELVLAGTFPIETIILVAVIFLNNYTTKKQLKGVLKTLEGL
jgi:hypothetical protein